MSEKIGCLLLSDSVEIGKAAEHYDDDMCKPACPHHDLCRVLKEGGSSDTRRDSQRTP